MAHTDTEIKDLKINFGTKAKVIENIDSMAIGELVFTTDNALPDAPTTDGKYVLGVEDGVKTWESESAGITDHAELENLDYASSGHTGFQPTISDLATIRSGAEAGATAYQKPSSGIPSSDLASAVQTSLGKADSAVQPAAISDMATKTWTNQQGFLTEHQSLSAYRTAANQDMIDNAIKGRLTTIEGKESGWDAKQEAVGLSVVSGKLCITFNEE